MNLSPQEAALYRAVDEVLHYIWDPIGVRDVPEARDEYESYLPQVFALLTQGEPAERIAEYLGQVTSAQMELEVDLARDLAVARVLVEWRTAMNAGTSRLPAHAKGEGQ